MLKRLTLILLLSLTTLSSSLAFSIEQSGDNSIVRGSIFVENNIEGFGDLTVTGTVDAEFFTGDGSALENLPVPDGVVLQDGSREMLAPLRHNAGSAATPSITFINDTDTGISSQFANRLDFSTSGLNRMNIDSTGNINFLEDVNLNADINFSQAVKAIRGTTVNPGLSFESDTDTGISSPVANRLHFSTAGISRMNIGGAGDITMEEDVILEQDIRFSQAVKAIRGNPATPGFSFASDTDTGISSPVTDRLDFSTAGIRRMTIASNGVITLDEDVVLGEDVTFSQSIKALNGNPASPSITFRNDLDTGLSSQFPNRLDFTTNGQLRLSIAADGTSTFSDPVRIADGSQGANKVLVSDGTGLASWQDLDSIPGGATGIESLSSTGTIDIINPNGPNVSIDVADNSIDSTKIAENSITDSEIDNTGDFTVNSLTATDSININGGNALILENATGDASAAIFKGNSIDFDEDNDGTVEMVLSNGNLGIGETAPDAKLALNSTEDSQFIKLLDSDNNESISIFTGASDPEGLVDAEIGSIYINHATGRQFTKRFNDGANTGWRGVANFNLSETGNAEFAVYREEMPFNVGGGRYNDSPNFIPRKLNTRVIEVGPSFVNFSFDPAVNDPDLRDHGITLTPGTYHVLASAPAFFVDHHIIRLQNITDGVTELLGNTAMSDNPSGIDVTHSLIDGFLVVTGGNKTFRLEHSANLNRNNENAFGHPSADPAMGNNIYSQISFRKVFNDPASLTPPGAEDPNPSGVIKIDEIAIFAEHQPSGTNGGAYPTANVFQTRTLNTNETDLADSISRNGNRIRLDNGQYLVNIWTSANRINRYQARLQNVTDNTTALIGSTQFTQGSTTQNEKSVIQGIVTVTDGPKEFEIQITGNTAFNNTLALGIAAESGLDEVYTRAVIQKFEIGAGGGSLPPEVNPVDLGEAIIDEIAVYADHKPSGTPGGSYNPTLNTPPDPDGDRFVIRELNAIETQMGSSISLSNNVITLQNGQYLIDAQVPGNVIGSMQARLTDITGNTTALLGTSAFANTGAQDNALSHIKGVLDVTNGPRNYILEMRGSSNRNTDGLGDQASSGEQEVYSRIRIQKFILGASAGSGDPGASGGTFSVGDFAVLEERTGANVDAGTYDSNNGFVTRSLNTRAQESGSSISLNVISNQITLQPGNYEVNIKVPAFGIGDFRARLQNITDGTTELLSQTQRAVNGVDLNSITHIEGFITVSDSAKVFEVQMIGEQTNNNNGLGNSNNFDLGGDPEIYTRAIFKRIE